MIELFLGFILAVIFVKMLKILLSIKLFCLSWFKKFNVILFLSKFSSGPTPMKPSYNPINFYSEYHGFSILKRLVLIVVFWFKELKPTYISSEIIEPLNDNAFS